MMCFQLFSPLDRCAILFVEGDTDYDLVFPLDLIDLDDNSTITVANEDELDALEDACEDSQG